MVSAVALLSQSSVHSTVIVYSRPLPLPALSALKLTLRSPVISQSGAVLPSPVPLIGSLLSTDLILHAGSASQLSIATAETVTGFILWLGGQRTSGLAETEDITGGVVSTTSMVCTQLLVFSQ